MKKQILIGLVVTTALFAQTAFAEPTCTKEAKDKWMTELDAQKKIVGDMGAKEGGAAGEMEKVEIYFNPLDLSIVEKKKG